jgi:hypothetical protein
MGDLAVVHRLLDRSRWRPSSSGKLMLVAQVTVEEALALGAGAGDGRHAVESWLLALSKENPPTTSLLMLIFDERRTSRGFLEVTLRHGKFAWSGH